MNEVELIRKRHSVRNYKETSIEEGKLSSLRAKIDECNENGNLHLQLCEDAGKTFNRLLNKALGLGSAPSVIACVGKDDDTLEERIRTWKELVNWINEVGFLPFFANEIEGFSAEENVSPDYWWTGIKDEDPWEWREMIAASHEVAYGKFFDKKSGFISVDWLPYFANARRLGYDFDSRWS